MNNATIRLRIIGAFAGILLILMVTALVAFKFLDDVKREAHIILTDSAPGTLLSAKIEAAMLGNYARVMRHLSLADPAARQKNIAEVQAVRIEIREHIRLYEATINLAADRALFDRFKGTLEPYWAAHDRVFKLSEGQDRKAIFDLVDSEVTPTFSKVRAALEEIVDYNEKNTLQTANSINTEVADATTAILAGFGAVIIASVIIGFVLLRAITRPLQLLVGALEVMRQGDFTGRMDTTRRDEFGKVGEGFNRMSDELSALVGQVQKSGLQVTTSVTEIAATSKQQQATATEIAATTAEIGSTSREISATSRQLVRTINEVSTVAEQSAVLASNGQAGLLHMGGTMRHVMEATKAINGKLVVLNEKAGNISQVISTISKVAEQTNLLSLNAAIEAEKAGEHGRGFSVVATEIRRLADQTAVATHDIGQTVKEIQSAVSASVMGMDKFSEEVRRGMEEVEQISGQLTQIIEQVQTLAPRVGEVDEGMQAQAAGAEQITQALAQLNESAQQTVESLRQSSMAIDELHQVANGLRGGVSRFRLQA
jgi:methyl-accepting chemotaxis protein WspA